MMGRFAPDDVLENADVYEKFTELAPMDVTKCKKVSSVQVNPVYTTFSGYCPLYSCPGRVDYIFAALSVASGSRPSCYFSNTASLSYAVQYEC